MRRLQIVNMWPERFYVPGGGFFNLGNVTKPICTCRSERLPVSLYVLCTIFLFITMVINSLENYFGKWVLRTLFTGVLCLIRRDRFIGLLKTEKNSSGFLISPGLGREKLCKHLKISSRLHLWKSRKYLLDWGCDAMRKLTLIDRAGWCLSLASSRSSARETSNICKFVSTKSRYIPRKFWTEFICLRSWVAAKSINIWDETVWLAVSGLFQSMSGWLKSPISKIFWG